MITGTTVINGVRQKMKRCKAILAIGDQELELVHSLRETLETLAPIWQQIPQLCWRAKQTPEDTSAGYHWTYHYHWLYATEYGLWPVVLGYDRNFAKFFVDCATGEVILAQQQEKIVSDSELRLLFGEGLDSVDPHLIVGELGHVLGKLGGPELIQKTCPIPRLFTRTGPREKTRDYNMREYS